MKCLLVLVFLFGGCASLEDELEKITLPRSELQRVREAFDAALQSSPDLNDNGLIDGLEWVALIQAAIETWDEGGAP